jgi:hypothetical protein
MTALPMAPKPRTVYWSERINGWWAGVPRRCPSCIGGHLAATPPNTPSSGPGSVSCINCSRELAEVLDGPTRPRVLPPEEPVKRGPKPKAVTQEKPRRYQPCADCRCPTGRKDAERCRPCSSKRQSENALSSRLIVLLGHGMPVPAQDIGRAFDLTPSGVRNLVRRARKRHPIGSTGAGHNDSRYWLETTS